MRRIASSSCTLFALIGLIGCSGSTTAQLATGGGNSVASGGSAQAGNPNGGMPNGGNPNGGNPNGGANATGGSPTLGTGGKSQNSGGGSPSGGAATGGANVGGAGVGGVVANTGGFSPATGGNPGSPTGGNAAGGAQAGGTSARTGGAAATGGSATAACSDNPRSSESCADAKSWGFCGQAWFSGNGYCNATCGTCSSSISTGGSGNTNTGGSPGAGGTLGAGGNATGGNPTTPTGGSQSTAGACNWAASSTTVSGQNGFGTRYWDCCMPSCSWSTQLPYCDVNGTTAHSGTSASTKSACDSGGNSYECYNFAPWYDSATNTSYGFAAYNGAACGTCFQLQFTGTSNGGSATGAATLKGKVMIVQVINIGGIGSNQFDLLIPGGGVGAMTAGCKAQWGNVDLGATYGGFLSTCSGDVNCARNMCNTTFAGKTDLLNGCLWFTDCYRGADNPNFVYSKVTCPSQITSRSKISG